MDERVISCRIRRQWHKDVIKRKHRSTLELRNSMRIKSRRQRSFQYHSLSLSLPELVKLFPSSSINPNPFLFLLGFGPIPTSFQHGIFHQFHSIPACQTFPTLFLFPSFLPSFDFSFSYGLFTLGDRFLRLDELL